MHLAVGRAKKGTSNEQFQRNLRKTPGSGIYWTRYAESSGRIRREKAGAKSAAIKLYRKRKTEVLQGKKLPENLRTRDVTLGEIAKAALEHSLAGKGQPPSDKIRMAPIVRQFGNRAAESLRPEELERWLNAEAEERGWALATRNRYVALLKLTYRLAEKNGKVRFNPARLLRMRKENNEAYAS
jgi:hypothetical protein